MNRWLFTVGTAMPSRKPISFDDSPWATMRVISICLDVKPSSDSRSTRRDAEGADPRISGARLLTYSTRFAIVLSRFSSRERSKNMTILEAKEPPFLKKGMLKQSHGSGEPFFRMKYIRSWKKPILA